jgi:hypothetical protein
MFFPAADTIAFAEGGAEAMRIDSSGNLGIGVTPSAWGSTYKALQTAGGSLSSYSNTHIQLRQNNYDDGNGTPKYTATAAASFYQQYNGTHQWFNAPSGTAGNAITFTQAMTLDASGRLAIGQTTANHRLDIKATPASSSYDGLNIMNSAGNGSVFNLSQTGTAYTFGSVGSNQSWLYSAYGDLNITNDKYTGGGSGIIKFSRASGTESMRIDDSGNLLVGTTTNADGVRGNFLVSENYNAIRAANSVGSGAMYCGFFQFVGRAPNDTGSQFITCNDSSATRFVVRGNGGIANYSANNVNLSDERVKKDIVDAGSYIDKICAIPVRTFLYKDQTDDELNLGVIAQEVEAVAPELVDLSGFGETPEDGVPLKAIYQTDLQYALMKSIQELKAIVDTQAEQIKALQGVK